ncbi:hypothetical protein NQ317_018805, partial [Molorchus minor]
MSSLKPSNRGRGLIFVLLRPIYGGERRVPSLLNKINKNNCHNALITMMTIQIPNHLISDRITYVYI